MIGRLRRWRAELALDGVDAQVARWLVYDGALSRDPLDSSYLSTTRQHLRALRLARVRRLEDAGGRDPWPAVLQPPTDEQRAAFARKR